MLSQFPKPHLIAVASLTAALGATLLVSPGNDVEAQRVTAHLDLATGQLKPATPADPEPESMMASAGPVPVPDQGDLLSIQPPDSGAGWQSETGEAAPDDDIAQAAPDTARSLEWKTLEVKSGDTLSRVFSRAGLNNSDMYEVINGEGKTEDLHRLQVGQELEFGLNDEGQLEAFTLHNSRTTKLQASRGEDGFITEEFMQEPDVELAFASGEIQTSYALAANRAGLSPNMRSRLSNVFGWQIDFGRELRSGDHFSVLYEEHHLDGEKIGYGRILAANFHNRGDEYSAVLYTDENGRSGYYAPDGSSMRKAFKRAPLDYDRVSSQFDLNREHPILNRTRPHEGTDFAARPGTPIKASGDGRITYIGRDGGYGRTIRIDHGNDVTTVYAHMQGYANGMRDGKRVRQGETIGYVGMSGLASGPHLHYEYRVSDRPRDPMRVDLPDADPVPDSKMDEFKLQAEPLLAQLSDHDDSFQVALAGEE